MTADSLRFDRSVASVAAMTPAPVRDREADRMRFTDPAFNRWLDEGISDAGHTVWDQIPDVCCAWHGWTNREHYGSAELTDAQIESIYRREWDASIGVARPAPSPPPLVFRFARAVLAAHPADGDEHDR